MFPVSGPAQSFRAEKFQELPVLGIPGMSESAFDGWALEGAANGPTTAASVVASAPPPGRRHPVCRRRRPIRGQRPIPDRRLPSSFRTRVRSSAWLPPPPALIWTGAGRRDMGRVQSCR